MNKRDETILIVDDEKGVRKLLMADLSPIYDACFEAAGAEEALEILKNNPVSIALKDINMPGKSGIELLSEVIGGYPDVAVIMISAVANSDPAIACMRQGAYDYVIKPFNSHEVVMRIEHALEKIKLKIDNRAYQLHLEQKVEEQTGKLRASEVNFSNSLENSPIGIRIVNSEGKTIYANRAFLDIFGYSNATELDSVPYDNLYTPETYAAHQERVRKDRLGETVPS